MSIAESSVSAPRARAELGWPRLLTFGMLPAIAAAALVGVLLVRVRAVNARAEVIA